MNELGLFRRFWFWVGLLGLLLLSAARQWPDRKVHLFFCDVGQGDAVLITYRSIQVLVDGGPDRRVLDCLSRGVPFWDREIEVVINTHPETDHLTGLVDVLERYRVAYLFLNSHSKESAVYKEFLKAVAEEEATVRFPTAGEKIRLGGLTVSFLWPQEQPQVLGASSEAKEINDTSLVTELSFGSFQALLSGDISQKVEEKLDLKDVEVLKVAHHGSRFSTGDVFLERAKPELAVISVGKNAYGHPTAEVLERLKNQAVELFRTDQAGTIEIISDGEAWGAILRR